MSNAKKHALGKSAPPILTVRGKKVILDSDLAVVYDVATKALNQAVKRNLDRFPEDFVFQLDAEKVTALRSQIVTSNERSQSVTAARRGGRRYRPYAFTEHGAVMAAMVLKSPKVVEMTG